MQASVQPHINNKNTPKFLKYTKKCNIHHKTQQKQQLTHADPAEVVLALMADHVQTALVLLDARVALWTLLGVGEDPLRGLAVGRALL